jgi:single-stranded-DNA-specific exonuclease
MISTSQKRWTIKPPGNPELVRKLSGELNISLVLANLLAQRGVKTFEEAKKFFRPSLNDLHDPFLMKDMDKAVSRIEQALGDGEKILVYGDYDVDGTTAVALVYSFLKSINANADFYLPDRYKEGYGISTQGIDYAVENNFSLVIALDCGIKSVDKIAYANEKKIDFIICDHHRPGEKIPESVAVLDPKRNDCDYPFKELSGCGIGFKLVQAFAQQHNIPFENLMQYLDLVAVSTAADIVPIVGENRVLTYFGLNWLNENPRPGIQAILELTNVKKQLTVSDIVFIIGPRINAAGRMQDARQAVDLLITANKEDALTEGKKTNETNLERRSVDSAITEHAFRMIEDDELHHTKKTTVLFNNEWHKGVIGIVASRLTEKYYRPTIVLTESNGKATGSARSVKNFDIYNAIESCSDLLEQFGGHMYAAGLTMKLENVELFREKFEDVVSSTIEEHMLVQQVEIDSDLKLRDITPQFFSVLKQFAPFGPGNMHPVFRSTEVWDTGYAKIVGTNHLKFTVTQAGNSKIYFNAIGFNLGEYLPLVTRKLPFCIAYTIEENEFNGKVSLQLNVKDIAVL